MKSLKEIIKQQENEKKEMTKKYEKNLKELQVKLNRIENSNNSKKMPTTTSYTNSALSPKANKLKASVVTTKEKNRSRSKEKLKSSKTNTSSVKPAKKILKKSPSLNGLNSLRDSNNFKMNSVSSPKSTKSSKSKKVKKNKTSSNNNLLKTSHQSSTLSGLSPRGLLSMSSIGMIY